MVFEQTPNNYGAYAPDVRGCVSTGSTWEEIQANIREALAFHIEGMAENGETIPEPRMSITEAMAYHSQPLDGYVLESLAEGLFRLCSPNPPQHQADFFNTPALEIDRPKAYPMASAQWPATRRLYWKPVSRCPALDRYCSSGQYNMAPRYCQHWQPGPWLCCSHPTLRNRWVVNQRRPGGLAISRGYATSRNG